MIVGVDFGAPRRAADQRRKIVAVAAEAIGSRAYRVAATGMNRRLVTGELPGWSARELLDELLARPARVVGFDFPFSVPRELLHDPRFAADLGHAPGAFGGWRAFNAAVAARLPLTDPLDFAPFEAWRRPDDRARLWTRRATDIAAGAQPPLKDRFQATFQMTLLGNALLARLEASQRYRVAPFPGGRGDGEVIEVYPGAALRAMGLRAYKSRPDEAVRRCLAACAAAGITVAVDPAIVDRARRYSSGTGASPDHDVADALVALAVAVLYAERGCHPALAGGPETSEEALREAEGVIWVPAVDPASAGAERCGEGPRRGR